jgi:hypothetical protein
MILDALTLFTGGPGGIGTVPPGTSLRIADLVTATGATSNNILDLAQGQTNTNNVALPPSASTPNAQPIRDLGIGDDPAMKILVQAIGGAWAPGGATIAVALQGSPDSGTGTPAGFTTYYSSTAVSGTTINTAGAGGARLMDMDMPRPPAGVAEPRFLQLLYTVAGGPFTGTSNFLIAGLVLDRADQVYNATNNTIWGGYPAGIVVQN